MKALLILAVLVVLLAAVSRLRLGAAVRYEPSGFTLRLKVGPVQWRMLPKRDRRRKKKKEPARSPDQGRGDMLSQLRRFLPVAAEAAGKLRRKIRIDHFYLDVIAGGSDPARAALAFGGVNGAVGLLWPLVEENFDVRDRRVRTKVDFSAGQTILSLDGAATLTLGQAVALAASLVPQLTRMADQEKHGKQQKKNTNDTGSVGKEAG